MHIRSAGAGEALYESPLRLEIGHGTRGWCAPGLGQKAEDCISAAMIPVESNEESRQIGGICHIDLQGTLVTENGKFKTRCKLDGGVP